MRDGLAVELDLDVFKKASDRIVDWSHVIRRFQVCTVGFLNTITEFNLPNTMPESFLTVGRMAVYVDFSICRYTIAPCVISFTLLNAHSFMSMSAMMRFYSRGAFVRRLCCFFCCCCVPLPLRAGVLTLRGDALLFIASIAVSTRSLACSVSLQRL